MSKYLLYKLNKNCAEIPNGCHNIAFLLGGLFLLAHPVDGEIIDFFHRGPVFFRTLYIYTVYIYVMIDYVYIISNGGHALGRCVLVVGTANV